MIEQPPRWNKRLFLTGYGLLACIVSETTMPASLRCADIQPQAAFEQIPLSPLNLSAEPAYPAQALPYFHFYQLHVPEVLHSFGVINTERFQIAAHVFQPAQPQGTVFLLHGYLDHVGALTHLIQVCLHQGYTVAAFDLPGHGLSSGERVHIADFSEYTDVVKAVLEFCRSTGLARPFHAIGHSTGGAILLDYLSQTPDPQIDFERIILLAPLVRSAHWRLTQTGCVLMEKFVNRIPRKVPNSSSDQEYIRFLKQDPLRGRYVPLAWLKALFAWEKRMRKQPAVTKSVLIVQGDKDSTVDWKYNLSFLRQKLEHSTIVVITGARHQLLNESLEYRLEVIRHIEQYLAGEAK